LAKKLLWSLNAWLFGVALLFAAPVNQSILIQLPLKATVVGPRISLGEVANVIGKEKAAQEKIRRVSLGKAAPAGRTIKVSKNYIKITLRREGYAVEDIAIEGAESTEVLTQSQEFLAKSLLPEIKNFVLKGLRESAENVEVRLTGPDKKLLIPAGKIKAEFRPPLSGKYEGSLLLTTELEVDGHLAKVLPLRVDVEVMRPAVVTTKRIEKGEKLTTENVALLRRQSSKILPGCLQNLENVLGRTAGIPLIPGTLLKVSSLYDPPAVKRGQVVQGVVQKGNIEITVEVKAIEDGKAGELIRVENTATHKLLRGRVLNEKMVSIEERKP
jgi:flagellar basal body P-ring formation protein FlgA